MAVRCEKKAGGLSVDRSGSAEVSTARKVTSARAAGVASEPAFLLGLRIEATNATERPRSSPWRRARDPPVQTGTADAVATGTRHRGRIVRRGVGSSIHEEFD